MLVKDVEYFSHCHRQTAPHCARVEQLPHSLEAQSPYDAINSVCSGLSMVSSVGSWMVAGSMPGGLAPILYFTGWNVLRKVVGVQD